MLCIKDGNIWFCVNYTSQGSKDFVADGHGSSVELDHVIQEHVEICKGDRWTTAHVPY